ncbi:hypothetical protein N7474_003680 [Penicillium riverlandense]|uniref:uncharacterized protein n=1 Tax=Penicillium riverlandense TaxID=1903569 RepID=UPI0025495156|nr:uncharacterized protein N7474_003680 [Penicillium riverlandense]KAJ5818089.1 hypothetical protein N7474_003680 [Penicillium riverlandense]
MMDFLKMNGEHLESTSLERTSNGICQHRLLEPFQRGETPTFMNHAKTGLRALSMDPYALLVFSGKYAIDSISQNLARDNHFFQDQYEIPASRIIVEPHATDSYQNVLFSLLQFRLYTGVYPRRVTVVTHDFKRARFMECHFPALGLLPITSTSTAEIFTTERDNARVTVIGINPPEEVTPVESLVRGELKRGIGLWRSDPYGVGPELSVKRRKRGWCPGMEQVSFDGLEDVVQELICWDKQEWFPKMEELPWFGLES